MSGSSYKNSKPIKIVITIILLSLWLTPIYSGKAAASADWGDVVDVNYSLWTDVAHTQPVTGNIDQPLAYIYIGSGSLVPPEVLELFPEARASFLPQFKEELIGIELNTEKEFVILSTEHNYPQELEGKNLYYLVRLTKIWYDVSEQTTTTTTTNDQKAPLGGIDSVIILGGGVVIFISGLLIWGSTSQKRRQKALGQDSTSSSRRERSLKQKKIQLKELRELAEMRETTKTSQEPSQPDVKFRRRR